MMQFHWCRYLAGALFLTAATLSYAAPQAATHTVIIDGMQFSPQTLEVNVGDTVIWKNKDPFPHTATSDGNGFDSGNIGADRSWKYVAKTRGTYPYVCSLHSNMRGVLVVK